MSGSVTADVFFWLLVKTQGRIICRGLKLFCYAARTCFLQRFYHIYFSLWWLDNLQQGVQYCGAKSIIKIDGFELRACHA